MALFWFKFLPISEIEKQEIYFITRLTTLSSLGESHTNVTFMFHKCNSGEVKVITTIWKKFHIFMKSGRLSKVIKMIWN